MRRKQPKPAAPAVIVMDVRIRTRIPLSQWECTTIDGKFVYVRYKHGILEIGVGAEEFAAIRARKQFDRGDWDNDVWISYEQLQKVTAGAFVWPAEQRQAVSA